MITRVKPQEFKRALSYVLPVVPNRAVVEVVQNVLLRADQRALEVAGTNLETTVIASGWAEVEQPGSLCVPAKLLSGIVGLLDDAGELLLKSEGTALSIIPLSSHDTSYKLAGISAEEFPPLPELDDFPWRLELGVVTVKRIIDAVLPAVSEDPYRPVLSGVSFRYSGDRLRVAASDGRRMGMISVPVGVFNVQQGEGEEGSCVVPSSTIRLLRKCEESVLVGWDQNQVAFVSGDVKIISPLIQGEFPNYESVISRSFGDVIQLELSRSQLIDAVRRVSLFADERFFTPIVLALLPNRGVFLIAEQYEVQNRAQEYLAPWYGSEVEVWVSSEYLLDALRAVDSEKVLIEITGPKQPLFLCRAEEKDVDRLLRGVLEVIMPINPTAVSLPQQVAQPASQQESPEEPGVVLPSGAG